MLTLLSRITPSTALSGSGIERTLGASNTIAAAYQNWQNLNVGFPFTATGSLYTAAPNVLWIKRGTSGGTSPLAAFADPYANTKPVITGPVDNYADTVNPSSGVGYPIDLSWQPMGTGNSIASAIEIEFRDKNTGFIGVADVFLPNGSFNPNAPTINVATGIYGMPTLQPGHSYIWRIRVAGTQSGQAIDSLWSDSRTINVTSLVISSSLPNGCVGTAYLQTMVASGGNPPYTWSVPVSGTGALPAGLTLNATTGTIYGIPTTAGITTVALTLTDSSQIIQTANLSITINPPAIVITTGSLPSGRIGSTYNVTLVAAGGTPPYTWSVPANGIGALPTGLSCNATTGGISGTPTVAVNATVAFTVMDSLYQTQTADLQITVLPINVLQVPLVTGWNTFSTPISLDSGNNTFAAVTSGASFDIAYGFNSQNQTWSTLTSNSLINPCDAIYIHLTSPCTLSLHINQNLTPPPAKNLYSGWNLASLANMGPLPPNQALVSVEDVTGGTGYTQVLSQAVGSQTAWTYIKGQTVSNQNMQPYLGYWVFMANGGTLAGFTTTP